jgi:hypothetical protein
MTNNPGDKQPVPAPDRTQPAPPHARRGSLWERISLALQLLLSLAVAGGVLAYLIWSGQRAPSADEEKRPVPPEEVVQLAGPRLVRVRPDTPLDSKLQVAAVEAAWLTAPVLPVTGNTLASLRPGREEAPTVSTARTWGLLGSPLGQGPALAVASLIAATPEAKDAWQFATPDLLSAFSDWNKAIVDVRFQKTQLAAIRELSEYRVEAQKKVVARMEKLVAAGTDSVKDLDVEKVNLRQFEIQGRKDTHDAENAVLVAQKTEATLARQLQQAGLEPAMLRSAAAEGDIVVAEVPERVMGRVKLGMTCEVRFFALPDQVFTGKVSSISPVISKEKRVLNVQFTVKDPQNLVRPGMFAEVGLGTDRRQALLMPADGVLHVGDREYALLGAAPQTWQITEVETGELRGTNVEVLSGLKAGDRVLGKGAILLKPVVARAIQAQASAPAVVKADAGEGGKN